MTIEELRLALNALRNCRCRDRRKCPCAATASITYATKFLAGVSPSQPLPAVSVVAKEVVFCWRSPVSVVLMHVGAEMGKHSRIHVDSDFGRAFTKIDPDDYLDALRAWTYVAYALHSPFTPTDHREK